MPNIRNPVIPDELFLRTKIKRIRALTTDTVLPTVPVPPPGQAKEEAALPSAAIWYTENAAFSGGPPHDEPILKIAPEFSPAVGVYLMAAKTGMGKTTLSMALAAYSNAMGTPASYISCFEPRAPDWKHNGARVFNDELKFDSDARMCIRKTDRRKLVIFDSVTLPMKVWASKPAFRQQSTFSGGMQPSDRGFIEAMADIADQHSACLILVLNSTLIPYVNDLAGGCEGIINPIDVGSFSYSDRTTLSRRRARVVYIPAEYVNAALDYFNFGEYSRTKARRSARGYEGI